MNALELFDAVLRLRWRMLQALRTVPAELLERDVGTDHRSILGTMLHVMVVEHSWVEEDLKGRPGLSWDAFTKRYLADDISLAAVVAGWQQITAGTLGYLQDRSDLLSTVDIPVAGGTRPISVEKIVLHLAGEEMTHFGEILAMSRQQGIDLPPYFLLDALTADEVDVDPALASRSHARVGSAPSAG